MSPSNPYLVTIINLMHERRLNHWLLSNQQELIYLNRSDSNQRDLSRCWCDSNRRDSILQIFWAQIFQLQNYSCAHHFWKWCRLQGFCFRFFCTMLRHAPIGKNWCISVKDIEAPNFSWWDSFTTILPESNSSNTIQTVNLWDYASDGCGRFHTYSIIRVLLKINTPFVTTLPTPKVYVPIALFLYINEIACLVSMNERVVRTRPSYFGLFIPILITNNVICYILVQLVFDDWSVINLWSVYFPSIVESDGFGRFSVYVL